MAAEDMVMPAYQQDQEEPIELEVIAIGEARTANEEEDGEEGDTISPLPARDSDFDSKDFTRKPSHSGHTGELPGTRSSNSFQFKSGDPKDLEQQLRSQERVGRVKFFFRYIVRRVSHARYWDQLLESDIDNDILYDRITQFWTLIGYMGAFVGAMCHVAFVEKPSWRTGATGTDSFWMSAYAISFFAGLIFCMGAAFVTAFLLSLLTHVPASRLKETFKGLIHYINAPLLWIFIGLMGYSMAFIFLTRITYSDTFNVWYAALGTFSVGAALGIIGLIYMGFSKPLDALPLEEDTNPGCLERTIAIFTISNSYLRMLRSGIPQEVAYERVTQLWTTVGLVATILGSISFEALWLRPQSADGDTDPDFTMQTHAFAFYFAVILNIYALVIGSLFVIMGLFFCGKDGMARLLHRLYYVASLPVILLFLGWWAIVVGLPFMNSAIYGKGGTLWKLSLVGLGFFGLGVTILVGILFAARKNKEARRRSTIKEIENHRSVRDIAGSFIDFFNLRGFLKGMIASDLEEIQIYRRVANVWTGAATIGSLMVFVSMLCLLTFGEYTSLDDSLPIFAAAMLVSTFLNLMTVFLAMFFLYSMVSVKHDELRAWLFGKAGFIFFPVITLGGGFIGLLVGLPIGARIIYSSDFMLYFASGTCIVTFLTILIFRIVAARVIPHHPTKEEVAAIKDKHLQQQTWLSIITRADLFSLLISSDIEEGDLFMRLRELLDGISLVAALLAVVTLDGFREPPGDPSDDTTLLRGYGGSTVMALCFNLLSLFLSVSFSFALSVVPANGVRLFLHRLRHIFFLPAITMICGVVSSLTSWLFFGQIQYNDLDGMLTTLRVLSGLMGIVMVWSYLFLVRASAHVSRHRTEVDPPEEGEGEFGVWMCMKSAFGHRSLTHSHLHGREIYQRMQATWTTTAVISVLISTLSFLGFQKGLNTSDIGIEANSDLERFYVTSQYMALCLTTMSAYLSTFLVITMLFVPTSAIKKFFKKVGRVLIMPNVLMMMGVISFLAGLPILGRSLYGQTVFIVCAALSWILLLGAIIAAITTQTNRYVRRAKGEV